MSKATDVAGTFLSFCKREGFAVEVRGEVVTIQKDFSPGDMGAFVDCDSMGPGCLSVLGAKGGSQWGTDGGSIGGMSAVKHGRYRLNQSGVPKRVSAAIQKML